jgi:hypothetical protein
MIFPLRVLGRASGEADLIGLGEAADLLGDDVGEFLLESRPTPSFPSAA